MSGVASLLFGPFPCYLNRRRYIRAFLNLIPFIDRNRDVGTNAKAV